MPDLAEPVIAWRFWWLSNSLVRGEDVRLRSCFDGGEWAPRAPLRARCDSCFMVPGSECRCGIYGGKDLTEWEQLRASGHTFWVAGEVKLWGRLIEGEYAWRAQFAYPASLYFLAKPWLKPEQIGALDASLDSYGVPVEYLPYRDALARAAPDV